MKILTCWAAGWAGDHTQGTLSTGTSRTWTPGPFAKPIVQCSCGLVVYTASLWDPKCKNWNSKANAPLFFHVKQGVYMYSHPPKLPTWSDPNKSHSPSHRMSYDHYCDDLKVKSPNKVAIEVQRTFCFYSTVLFLMPTSCSFTSKSWEVCATRSYQDNHFWKSNRSFQEYNLGISPTQVKSGQYARIELQITN